MTTSSFVSYWKDCTSISDRKVNNSSLFASTQTLPVSWYGCGTHHTSSHLFSSVLSCCAVFNELKTSSSHLYNFPKRDRDVMHQEIAARRTVLDEDLVGMLSKCLGSVGFHNDCPVGDNRSSNTRCIRRCFSKWLLLPRCSLSISDNARGYAWFSWRKKSPRFPSRFWQPMQSLATKARSFFIDASIPLDAFGLLSVVKSGSSLLSKGSSNVLVLSIKRCFEYAWNCCPICFSVRTD